MLAAIIVTLNEFLPSLIAITTTIITIIQRYFINVHSTFQLKLLFHCTSL